MKRVVAGIIIGLTVLFFAGTAVGEDPNCHVENSCPGSATCKGSYYTVSGCTITCYNQCGTNSAQICWAAEAKCSQSGKREAQEPTP